MDARQDFVAVNNVLDRVLGKAATPPINRRLRTGEEAAQALLLDKLRFSSWLRDIGLTTTNDLALVEPHASTLLSREATLGPGRYFVKPTNGTKGQGCFVIEGDDSSDVTLTKLQRVAQKEGQPLLVQALVDQHEAMSAFSGDSVNTLRLLTYRREGKAPSVLAHCVLRVGRKGNVVDNAAAGGLVVLVRDGATHGPGIDKQGGIHTTHPDTGSSFSTVPIPYFTEAVSMAQRAHDRLPLWTVGWDVAITPEGPLIIEANADWDSHLHIRADARRFYIWVLAEALGAVIPRRQSPQY